MKKLLDSDYKEIVKSLLFVSSEASKKILEIYNKKKIKISIKEDLSPVTKADTEANQIIVRYLKKNFPGIAIFSEETKNTYKSQKIFFLVDPLDGTKEFISKNGEFTVNIGLVVNNRAVLGVVEVPVKNLQYFSDGNESFIVTNKKIKKIQIKKRIKKIKILTSRSHIDEKTTVFVNQFKNCELYKKGSSLKICSIAAGDADLYPRFGNTMEWDICAAHAILKTSGGSLTDLKLAELSYGKKKMLNDSFIAFGNVDKEDLLKKLKF